MQVSSLCCHRHAEWHNRTNVHSLAFHGSTKSYLVKIRTAIAWGWYKSFTHIEHRAAVVGREVLVCSIPVLTSNYLLPWKWVPVLTATYLLLWWAEYVFTLYKSMAQNQLSNMYPLLLRSALRSFAPSQKSRHHNRSCEWAQALSAMIFVAAQKLSALVWT